MRLIHSADWHIGKVFGAFDDEPARALREARLDAIGTIGALAREHDARRVLVAGDVYDHAGLGDYVLDQALEQMRRFPDVAWHLIPGNHDPDVADGIWTRIVRRGLPENVHLHREPEPVLLAGDDAWLLPAPLQRRHSLSDPTAWMDQAATPEGAPRIGLAHGPVLDFGAEDAPNRIAAERAVQAGLDYLALGDRHGRLELGPRTAYAGTPEPDDFGQAESGSVLLVELAGPGAVPRLTPLATGRFHWHRERAVVLGADDVERLDERLRARHPDPRHLVVRLEVEGRLALADRLRFDQRIDERLRAALRVLDLRADLETEVQGDDLDAIAAGGVLRTAAEALKARIETSSGEARAIAEQALQRLLIEQRKVVR